MGLGLAVDADQPRGEIGDVVHVYPGRNVCQFVWKPFRALREGRWEPHGQQPSPRAQLNPFFADQLDSPVVFNGQTIQASGFRSTNKRLAFSGGVRGT